MKLVITIDDEVKDADFAITVQGEHTRLSRAKSVFELILPVLEEYFTPTTAHFRTRVKRKEAGA